MKKMENAIKYLYDLYIEPKDLVIASTGMASRVVHHVHDSSCNFYVQGSMGASLGIGLGLALNTKRTVHVIAGDGDILMSLGTVVLMNKLNLPNLFLHILDNSVYGATGGQPTCSAAVDFNAMANNIKVLKISSEKPNVERIPFKNSEIAKRFYNEINTSVQ